MERAASASLAHALLCREAAPFGTGRRRSADVRLCKEPRAAIAPVAGYCFSQHQPDQTVRSRRAAHLDFNELQRTYIDDQRDGWYVGAACALGKWLAGSRRLSPMPGRRGGRLARVDQGGALCQSGSPVVSWGFCCCLHHLWGRPSRMPTRACQTRRTPASVLRRPHRPTPIPAGPIPACPTRPTKPHRHRQGERSWRRSNPSRVSSL